MVLVFGFVYCRCACLFCCYCLCSGCVVHALRFFGCYSVSFVWYLLLLRVLMYCVDVLRVLGCVVVFLGGHVVCVYV